MALWLSKNQSRCVNQHYQISPPPLPPALSQKQNHLEDTARFLFWLHSVFLVPVSFHSPSAITQTPYWFYRLCNISLRIASIPKLKLSSDNPLNIRTASCYNSDIKFLFLTHATCYYIISCSICIHNNKQKESYRFYP